MVHGFIYIFAANYILKLDLFKTIRFDLELWDPEPK